MLITRNKIGDDVAAGNKTWSANCNEEKKYYLLPLSLVESLSSQSRIKKLRPMRFAIIPQDEIRFQIPLNLDLFIVHDSTYMCYRAVSVSHFLFGMRNTVANKISGYREVTKLLPSEKAILINANAFQPTAKDMKEGYSMKQSMENTDQRFDGNPTLFKKLHVLTDNHKAQQEENNAVLATPTINYLPERIDVSDGNLTQLSAEGKLPANLQSIIYGYLGGDPRGIVYSMFL